MYDGSTSRVSQLILVLMTAVVVERGLVGARGIPRMSRCKVSSVKALGESVFAS